MGFIKSKGGYSLLMRIRNKCKMNIDALDKKAVKNFEGQVNVPAYEHYVRPDHSELFKAKVRELGKHQVEITAPASLVFVGNINVSIETALRTSHLHFLLKLYNHQDVVINIVILMFISIQW